MFIRRVVIICSGISTLILHRHTVWYKILTGRYICMYTNIHMHAHTHNLDDYRNRCGHFIKQNHNNRRDYVACHHGKQHQETTQQILSPSLCHSHTQAYTYTLCACVCVWCVGTYIFYITNFHNRSHFCIAEINYCEKIFDF